MISKSIDNFEKKWLSVKKNQPKVHQGITLKTKPNKKIVKEIKNKYRLPTKLKHMIPTKANHEVRSWDKQPFCQGTTENGT